MKKRELIGFADLAVQKRKVKSVFFDQVNTIVDWRPISNIINKHYVKGSSAVGCPAHRLFFLGV